MSRNRDAALLEQHHPDIYAWVFRSLSGIAHDADLGPHRPLSVLGANEPVAPLQPAD
jgi:hypothetical protein